ncbi:hypothetical protein D9M68_368050 [compost metagenome]
MRRRYCSRGGALRMGLVPAMEALQSAMQARQFSNLHQDNNKSIVTTAVAENR